MKTAPHYLLLTDTDQFDDQTSATAAAEHSPAPANPAGGRWPQHLWGAAKPARSGPRY